MELVNATRMLTACNIGMEPSGRELLVVVVKGTFRIPQPGAPAGSFALHDEQAPLVMADTFTGEPGKSAPLHEIDFAPRKNRCDILLNGTAYAPNGHPALRVDASVSVGDWRKTVTVVGPRHWDCGAATLRATSPDPFTTQAISYDHAFGGVDAHHDDPAQHDAYLPNPVGCGFHKHLKKAWVDGKPLPSIEEPGSSISDPHGRYRPMAFGPVGRGWQPRAALAGTYDDAWLKEHFPFLPPDFNELYYQAAPADQQVPLGALDAGASVTLQNLTPQGHTRFDIPRLVAPVSIFPRRGARENHIATLDTLVIEPDLQRFSLTWRVTRPLVHDVFEIAKVQVGKRGREWWQRSEEVSFPAPNAVAAA